MHIKSILLKVLVLAMLLPTVALAQSKLPTQAEFYQECMDDAGRRKSTPGLAESIESIRAKAKKRHEINKKICACQSIVQVKEIKTYTAMGFDGSKASDKRLDADPALRKKLMQVMLDMSNEKSKCMYDAYE